MNKSVAAATRIAYGFQQVMGKETEELREEHDIHIGWRCLSIWKYYKTKESFAFLRDKTKHCLIWIIRVSGALWFA